MSVIHHEAMCLNRKLGFECGFHTVECFEVFWAWTHLGLNEIHLNELSSFESSSRHAWKSSNRFQSPPHLLVPSPNRQLSDGVLRSAIRIRIGMESKLEESSCQMHGHVKYQINLWQILVRGTEIFWNCNFWMMTQLCDSHKLYAVVFRYPAPRN